MHRAWMSAKSPGFNPNDCSPSAAFRTRLRYSDQVNESYAASPRSARFAPSGRTFESTGHVTCRFRDGKIADTWFNWDTEGMK